MKTTRKTTEVKKNVAQKRLGDGFLACTYIAYKTNYICALCSLRATLKHPRQRNYLAWKEFDNCLAAQFTIEDSQPV